MFLGLQHCCDEDGSASSESVQSTSAISVTDACNLACDEVPLRFDITVPPKIEAYPGFTPNPCQDLIADQVHTLTYLSGSGISCVWVSDMVYEYDVPGCGFYANPQPPCTNACAYLQMAVYSGQRHFYFRLAGYKGGYTPTPTGQFLNVALLNWSENVSNYDCVSYREFGPGRLFGSDDHGWDGLFAMEAG